MNRHIVQTSDTIDDATLREALDSAGIDAQVKPLHLQRAASVAAAIIEEYPEGQREHARDTLIRWMDEALDAADEARLKRINDSIDRLEREHGGLETWRSEGGYIALDVPTALITSITTAANDARRDIELRTLTGLMLPQLERIPPQLMQRALGSEYAGNRGDYGRLVAIVCQDLGSI